MPQEIDRDDVEMPTESREVAGIRFGVAPDTVQEQQKFALARFNSARPEFLPPVAHFRTQQVRPNGAHYPDPCSPRIGSTVTAARCMTCLELPDPHRQASRPMARPERRVAVDRRCDAS